MQFNIKIHENANSSLVPCHDDNTKDAWIWEVKCDEKCAYTHTVSPPFMECIQSISAFSLSTVKDIKELANIANFINIPKKTQQLCSFDSKEGQSGYAFSSSTTCGDLRNLISLKHNLDYAIYHTLIIQAEAGSCI